MKLKIRGLSSAAVLLAVSVPFALLAQGRGPGQGAPPAPVNIEELPEARRVPAEQQTALYKNPNWKAPRTSWGDPDLAGIYSTDDETGTPMERPDDLEGFTLATITPEKIAEVVAERDRRFKAQVDSEAWRNSISPPPHLIFDTFDRRNKRPWLITDPVDGKIPPRTAEAQARARVGGVSTNQNSRGPFNSYLDMGLYDRCITRGIPNSMMPAGYGSRYEIVQSPDTVAIRYEMIHEARVIPLDRRPHIANELKQYLGDARGWWDGDTLVIETTNFRAETAPQRASETVKMIDRFTRTFERSSPSMIPRPSTACSNPG